MTSVLLADKKIKKAIEQILLICSIALIKFTLFNTLLNFKNYSRIFILLQDVLPSAMIRSYHP